MAAQKPVTVGIVNLGCAKNLVDAEIMLGSVLQRGMQITNDPARADVVIVNTCSFIDAAKEESIEAILEAHQQRGLRKKPGQRLIVAGCLAQRFGGELAKELSEVDAFIGLDQVAQVPDIIETVLATPPRAVVNGRAGHPAGGPSAPLQLVTRGPRFIPDFDTPRFQLTPAHFAYVKIAEGCNHPCTFCVIPQIRGRHRSRTIESVTAEVRALVARGVREINLVSQDTTYYGMDLWAAKAGPRQPVDPARGPTLVGLLEALEAIQGDFWVRLLYTHPAHWSDALMAAIAASSKVCRYIDIPLQHIHPRLLAAMRRETSQAHIEDLLARLRATIPGIAIRTTFIVGFPGETEAEFEVLLDFIGRMRFERLGVFQYSQEEGSRAARLPDQVPARIKAARYRQAMALQQRIAWEHAKAQAGRILRVLADTPVTARSEADAPEVDARVLLTRPVSPGRFVEVRVTGSDGYDLLAEPTASSACQSDRPAGR